MLREIQYKNILEEVIRRIRQTNQTIDLSLLFDASMEAHKQVEASRLFYPPVIEYHSVFPIDEFNNSLKLLNIDYKTLIDFNIKLIEELKRYEIVSQIYDKLIASLSRRVTERSASLIIGSKLEGFNVPINPIDVVNTELSNMEIDSGVIGFAVKSIKEITALPQSKDIRDYVTNVDIQAVRKSGLITDIFNPLSRSIYDIMVYLTRLTKIDYNLEVKYPFGEVNRVVIDTLADPQSTLLTMLVSDDNGVTWNTISTQQIKDQTTTIDFSEREINMARFVFSKQSGTIDKNVQKYEYRFQLKSIRFNRTEYRKKLPVFISKKIDMGEKVRKVSILVDNIEASDTVDVGFYLTTEVDSNNIPTGWIKVIPIDSYTEPTDQSIVDLFPSERLIRSIKQTANEWRLTSINNTDVNLYNILENSNPVLPNGISIVPDISNPEDTYIEVDSTLGIIDLQSVKLYRGIYDWAIETSELSTSNESGSIHISIDPNINSLGYKPIDLVTMIYDEIVSPDVSVDASARTVSVRYVIYDFEGLRIKDVDGNDIVSQIEQVIGTNAFTVDLPLSPRSKYKVTYKTRLKDIEDKDDAKATVVVSTLFINSSVVGDMIRGTDYSFTPETNRIYISNKYVGLTDINMRYAYSTTSKRKYQVYTTYVKIEEESIELDIQPFSKKEIELGNFHIVDNVYVSDYKAYTLTKGWHELKTTQVYPTDPLNDNDVNQITKEASDAGIYITDGIYYRAFRNSLRNVSKFVLGNEVKPKDHRSFSFENQRVLLNRQPDFIRSAILSSAAKTSHQTGKQLLCKKPDPSYSGSGDYYIAKPEEFELEFTIDGLDDIESDVYQPSHLYLKIQPTTKDVEGENVRISGISINNLSVV